MKIFLISFIFIACVATPCFADDIQHSQQASVTRIIDGDTFKAKIDKTIETIRLIGIDTPELHHPSKPVQCFAVEASQNLTSLLQRKNITLLNEPQGSNRDVYGRLLRYVYIQSEPFAPVVFINATMIQNGSAYAYTHFDFRYKQQFKEYQNNAKAHKRGLWSQNTCNGKR